MKTKKTKTFYKKVAITTSLIILIVWCIFSYTPPSIILDTNSSEYLEIRELTSQIKENDFYKKNITIKPTNIQNRWNYLHKKVKSNTANNSELREYDILSFLLGKSSKDFNIIDFESLSKNGSHEFYTSEFEYLVLVDIKISSPNHIILQLVDELNHFNEIYLKYESCSKKERKNLKADLSICIAKLRMLLIQSYFISSHSTKNYYGILMKNKMYGDINVYGYVYRLLNSLNIYTKAPYSVKTKEILRNNICKMFLVTKAIEYDLQLKDVSKILHEDFITRKSVVNHSIKELHKY